jgi:hypothetical protein
MSMISAPRREEGKLEFRLLMWVAFTLFFVAIAFTRLLPASVRPRIGGDSKNKSIFAAAKTAAYSSIPFAFM